MFEEEYALKKEQNRRRREIKGKRKYDRKFQIEFVSVFNKDEIKETSDHAVQLPYSIFCEHSWSMYKKERDTKFTGKTVFIS